MKKFTLWMMAAILICSPVMFTSCTSEDNPTGSPTTEEKNPDRAVFEKILSEKLAQDSYFRRIDLYEVNGNILFGEVTFYPNSGFGRFTNIKWDYKLGEWIHLDNIL